MRNIFSFGDPYNPTILIRGSTGPTGSAGVRGATGATGATGVSESITIQKTTTGTPEQEASVIDHGTGTQHLLEFVIPRGKTGEKGADGEKGEKGDSGDKGEKGEKGEIGPTGATGPAASECYYSMKYTGNTGTHYTTPTTILKAPVDSNYVTFNDESIIINEAGYYEIYMSTTCDTSKLGSTLYGGIILTINDADQVDGECLIPNSKYAVLSTRQIFQLKNGDVLKVKNEGVAYGTVNGHLYFQIKKLYF